MALSIKKVGEIRRTVTIPFDGDDLNVTYRLGALNMKLSDWLQEHGDERGSQMEWIERVAVDWDLLDDAGAHLPVTVAVMEQFEIPTPLLYMISNAIYADASSKNLTAAYETSLPSVLASAQNGMPTS